MLKLKTPARPRDLATMTVMEAIYGRRSVRSYAAQEIGPGVIRDLLDAAVHAPTAVHEEPWAFLIIQDRKTLRRLSETAKRIRRNEERGIESRRHSIVPDNVFYDADTLIVIYGKPLGRYVAADCWLAAQNLMLAAHAMGLGSCVIGFAIPALNRPEWKTELGVPSEMTAYAPIIVGVPADQPPPAGRQPPQIIAWKTSPAA